MISRIAYFAALIAISSSANASYKTSSDRNGCWDAKTSIGDKCIQQTSHTWSGNKITVTYKNRCANRLYAMVCHNQTGGVRDCESFGIRGNSTHRESTFNATGDINYNAVGSTNASNDYLCQHNWKMRVR